MKTFELTKVEKILFYLYRIFCMLFTINIIANLTTLGDYGNYVQGDFFYELKMREFYSSTHFMRFLIGFF